MSQDLPNELLQKPINQKDYMLINVLNHQRYRFAQLYRLLQSDPEITVIIPINTSVTPLEHGLGRGLAVGMWNSINSDYSKSSIDNLTQLVDLLIKKFPEQVKYGAVGTNGYAQSFTKGLLTTFVNQLSEKDKKKLVGYNGRLIKLIPPSNKVYHVWGANEDNWNLPNPNAENPNNITIPGANQAAAMGEQKIGIFGVITTPVDGNNLYRSQTDTINPYKSLENYREEIKHIIDVSRLSDQQKQELIRLIDSKNVDCLQCIDDGIDSLNSTLIPISAIITILHNSNVITKAKFSEYDSKIKHEALKGEIPLHGSHMKYLKYKQKYLALKKSLNM